MGTINERVIPLDEADELQIAEGDPDVRGWRVFAADGERIGFVDELLVDTEELKVRYLDVELEEDDTGREEHHVLIPVGFARLDDHDDYIRVDGFDSAALRGLPAYTQEPLTYDFETELLRVFEPHHEPAPPAAADRYARESYDEDRFYGSRRGETDG